MPFNATQLHGNKVTSLRWNSELLFDGSFHRPYQRSAGYNEGRCLIDTPYGIPAEELRELMHIAGKLEADPCSSDIRDSAHTKKSKEVMSSTTYRGDTRQTYLRTCMRSAT